MAFETAFKKTVGIEGGYANDPQDPGGETMWGITARVARAWGYTGPMRDMPVEVAKEIYRSIYWDKLRLDDVDPVAPEIADELFDTAVNCGVPFAGKSLQQALNALNRNAQDYRDLVEDGSVGPGTIAALQAYARVRGPRGVIVLARTLNGLQLGRYLSIVRRDPTQEKWFFGWVLNRVTV